MSKPVVFLDGDDTLWKTQELYDEAKQAFASLMTSIGIKEDNLIDQLDELDAQRVPLRGFSIQRFAESMLIMYARLSQRWGLPLDPSVKREIHNIVNLVKRTPKLYDDAIPFLEKLQHHVVLTLLSVGDPVEQRKKLDALHIRHFFDDIHIVSKKDEKLLTRLLQRLKVAPKESWMVGNSLRSDILPALSAGMNAILVERGTWRYDEVPKTAFSDAKYFYKTRSLLTAANIILSQLKEKQKC